MSATVERRCHICGTLIQGADAVSLSVHFDLHDWRKGERYFLTAGDAPEREVTMDEYVRAERSAGFHNTGGLPEEPATGGFSNGFLRGRTSHDRALDQAPVGGSE